MRCLSTYQVACCATLIGVLLQISPAIAAKNDAAASDQRIRKIVESMLQEKNQKIEQLEARIKQLENNQPAGQQVAQPKKSSNVAEEPNQPKVVAEETLAASPVAAAKPIASTTSSESNSTLMNKLGDLGEEIAELKEDAKEKGLDISGFFDINAKTDNSTDQTFSVGSVELDLEYLYNEHFAASSAVVLCGNSSGADLAAPAAITCGGSGPGGLGGGSAGFAVALIDYHMFDNTIPPRGRIFNNQGFHVQAGRFDIPFSTDYQFFANKDRVSVTAPITTSRMQLGGFNGDGLRSYGTWNFFNYSVFWTDAMFANDGTSVGGRIGLAFGKNNYRSHKNNPEGIEAGVSYLGDLDKNRNLRHAVYGADLSMGYGFLRLQNELMLTQAYNNFIFTDDNGSTDYGKPHEFGYHSTLSADLERFIKYPVIAFVRYGRWQPKARFAQDFDGTLVSISNISALTVGLNYRFNEYFKLKFEYTDSLGTSTKEHYFDKKLGIAQMVVSF
jgi:hypothetical protein